MESPILNKEVQEYIRENYNEDVSRIILSGSPFATVSAQELAIQLIGKKKAEKKMPTWFSTPGILYPPALNLEQTSSEKTAAYKASLLNGSLLADLTGGFGIDSYYFSKRLKKIIHIEQNGRLSALAAHNFKALGVENVETRTGDSLNFLKETTLKFDWIYVDPSRRDDAGGRVFLLSDCLPNLPEHLDLLFEKSAAILIKTSPLLDLQAGLSELESVKEIHVIAVDNDVKELLWILEKKNVQPLKVVTGNFRKNGEDELWDATYEPTTAATYSLPLAYLYEPNAAVMKSGLANTLGNELNLFKLHPNSQLFTSTTIISFPGRRFEILQSLPYHKKKLKKELDLKKANITTRNFPLSVDNIRKQLKISEGGDHYLFFTTLENEEKVCLVCKKI